MQVNPLIPNTSLSPSVAAAVQSLRVMAGDISQIQTSVAVSATVLRAGSGEAVLDLAGKPITVKTSLPLAPGDALNVRVNAGANPTVDILTQPKVQLGLAPASLPASNAITNDIAAEVVDVLTSEPGGQYRVRIGGREVLASSENPLTTGGRYILQAESGPAGLTLKPPPDSPQRPSIVATAVLKSASPAPLGEAVRPLIRELDTVLAQPLRLTPTPAPTTGSSLTLVPTPQSRPPVPAPDVRQAAIEVREALQSILPPPGEPPTVATLQALVRHGGQQFEMKLARMADPSGLVPDVAKDIRTIEVPTKSQLRPEPNISQPPPRETSADRADNKLLTADLKGGLLNLLRAVPDVASVPVTAGLLDGIERQQAVNVLAQQNGGPLVFQVPFPDGPNWRTLSLGIEPDPDSSADPSARPRGFRVMMHVLLNELGETWIDAGAGGNRLRAVLYVSNPMARERVLAELGSLRPELHAAGFTEVWLDAKPAAELTDRQRQRANAIRGNAPESGGLLDVRA